MSGEKTIGLLGGSFNPVHTGHLMLASYLQQWGGLDEVWLVLSPLNPLKPNPEELLPDMTRLKMLDIAVKSVPGVEVCDIELTMPRPSYTINTLRLLSKRYPRRRFKLIIGSDNWRNFEQWCESEEIISDYGLIIYPRPGYPVGRIFVDGVDVANAPQCEISSSFIRSAIGRGKNMNIFLPPGVYDYIRDNHLYERKP